MSSNSSYIFDYLNDVWDLLSEEDRSVFAETWKAYEQTYGASWATILERKMAVNIDYLPLYNNQRWLKHKFNTDTQALRRANYRSPQDLSLGINLQNRYLIKLAINSATPVEIDLRGINPSATTISEIVNNINTAVGKVVAYSIQSGQLLEFRSDISGPLSKIEFFATSTPSADASEIILGLDPSADLPLAIPKFPYEYMLGDQFIVKIPTLQDAIIDENITLSLTEGVDYEIEFGTGVISFQSEPPEEMWAPDSYVNLETPYNNYGYLLGIYDKNTESYLKAVKGLWYAFWTGPRPENIRRSLYLLFGLPVSSQAGTVTNVTLTSVELLYEDQTTETFSIPVGLSPIVNIGQSVSRFEPLVSGIRVFDKVNYPGFIEKEVGRAGIQQFLTEKATRGVSPDTDESKALRILEENTYLPQIDVSTFISPDIKLNNVKTFLSNLQPKSRTYLFQVLIGVFRDEIDVRDEGYRSQTDAQYPNGLPALIFDIGFDATPNLDWNPNTEVDQTQLDEAENNDYTYMRLDEGWATGDKVEIDVYQSITLIDSFNLEG